MIRHTLVSMFLLALFSPALAQSIGKIKVCKEGKSDDWPDQSYWAREVVVPVGAVFKDAGAIDSKDVLEGLIRLRVVTVEAGIISGKKKCITLRGIIPDDGGDWGNLYAGPVRTKITKSDNRMLNVERLGNSDKPAGKLAPWADVVPVEGTIEQDFR